MAWGVLPDQGKQFEKEKQVSANFWESGTVLLGFVWQIAKKASQYKVPPLFSVFESQLTF